MNAPSEDWSQTNNILSLQDITDGSQAILFFPPKHQLTKLWNQTKLLLVTLYINHQALKIDMNRPIPATNAYGAHISFLYFSNALAIKRRGTRHDYWSPPRSHAADRGASAAASASHYGTLARNSLAAKRLRT